MKIKFNKKLYEIVDFNLFKGLDPELSDFLLNYAKDHLVISNKEKQFIRRRVKYLDYFSWSVEDHEIDPLQNKIFAQDLFHQAVHNLVGDCYGNRREGHPKVTLLNEAIGAGTAFYWTILDLKNGKNNFWLSTYLKNAEQIGVNLLPLVNYSIKNPYHGYLKVVEETYSLFLKLLKELSTGASDVTKTRKLFIAHIKKEKWPLFYSQFSISGPIYFVANYCGVDSEATDIAGAENCLKKLKEEESLINFFSYCNKNKL